MPDFLAAKARGARLTLLTAYDYTTARLLDLAGVDGILVGDSVGTIVQGEDNTLGVTLDEMVYHTRCVARGIQRALLIADLPFMSYQVSPQQAVASAGRLVKEGKAHAVKLEGGRRSAAGIAAVVAAEVPVMGHVGMTPQSVRRFGGFRVQRDEAQILDDAIAVAEAGAFAIVAECIPQELAARMTAAVSIPVIGIGAGPDCDGQVLVTHDLLGLFNDFRPRFVKRYAELGSDIVRAVEQYVREVRLGEFPAAEHTFR